MRWLIRQFLIFLSYWLIPFVCFGLPRRPAAALAVWASRRAFMYRIETHNAWRNANEVLDIADENEWKAEFRMVRLLDAIDLWHGLFSSDRRIERALVTQLGEWPQGGHFLAVGTHVGPGTLLLRSISAAGTTPAISYRKAPEDIRWRSPLTYWYMRLRIYYMRRVCDWAAITTPGIRDKVKAAMSQDGCAPVLVFGAPALGEHVQEVEIFGRSLRTARRGLEMAHQSGSQIAFYRCYWDPESRRRVFEIEPARAYDDASDLVAENARFLRETIERFPPQWQLWGTDTALLSAQREPVGEEARD